MKFEYRIENDEVTILRCLGEGNRVEIPECIDGYPVVRLESYIFSNARREPDTEKAICGGDLIEVQLPVTVREIGNYAFYGCRNLKKLTVWHRIENIAGGAFTGCHHIKELVFYMKDACGHSLKDMVSELHYELRITLIYENGEHAELLFPEYYEEAVENTPARNVDMAFHGSGYYYRQIFRDGELYYPEYDRHFFEAQHWECEDFCVELTLLRLRNPYQLSEDAKGCYMAWLMEHRIAAGTWCIEFEQEESLEFLSGFVVWSAQDLEILIEQANRQGRISMQSYLMDYKHQHFKKEKKTFEW